jgi:hypothetical protein
MNEPETGEDGTGFAQQNTGSESNPEDFSIAPTLSQSLARTVMPRQASTDCLSGQLPVLFRYSGTEN